MGLFGLVVSRRRSRMWKRRLGRKMVRIFFFLYYWMRVEKIREGIEINICVEVMVEVVVFDS